MAARLLATALETAVNGALQLDPVTRERLAQLQDRVIAVEPAGLDATFFLQPGPGGLRVLTQCNRTPELTVRGSPLALLALARGTRTGSGSEIELDGDAELGRRLQALLAGLDVDWEEALARVIGDLPAHQAGNLVRAGHRWGQHSIDSLLRNVSEYVQYERCLLPPAHAVQRFVADVDRLRDDMERLEARVQRLTRRLRSC